MSILRTEPAHRAERGRHLRAQRIRERGGDSASDLILKLGHRPLFTRTPLQTTLPAVSLCEERKRMTGDHYNTSPSLYGAQST